MQTVGVAPAVHQPAGELVDDDDLAVEAKENVKVENESKTLATITFQNFFRLYPKLSGMTGTALTEQEEFSTIYSLDVVEIPTNRPVARLDDPDVVYKTQNGKYRAVIEQVRQCHEKGQPVLVGTISIEKSELLSRMLKKEGIAHTVLNAKQHEREAEIVAQAGRSGMVTIATNMAGRGTDIVLGGNPEYMAKDDLRKQGLEERLIVESNSFAETDDAEILAARAAYSEAYERYKQETDREAEKVRAAGGLFIIGTERHESRRIDNQLRGRAGRQGDPGETRFYLSMEDDIMRLFGAERIMNMMDTLKIDEDTPIDQKILSNAIESAQRKVESVHFQQRKNVLEYDDVMNTQRKVIYEQRQKVLNGEDLQAVPEPALPICGFRYEELERVITLRVVDEYWMEQIDSMQDLRQGIVLRAYGQNNPVIEYKREGYEMFSQMISAIREETIRRLFVVKLKPQEEVKREKVAKDTFEGGPVGAGDKTLKRQPTLRKAKVGRNDPCPCGSGKKYKNCCLDKDLNG